MPTAPTPAQSESSRLNGAHSSGPASEAGKVRSAMNGVRHGLTGREISSCPMRIPKSSRRMRRYGSPNGSRATSRSGDVAELAIRRSA